MLTPITSTAIPEGCHQFQDSAPGLLSPTQAMQEDKEYTNAQNPNNDLSVVSIKTNRCPRHPIFEI